MKILIDIGHPAHVHYFRNLIKIMEKKGHEFLVIAKNKSVTHKLLSFYKIPYLSRRNYPKSLIGKLFYIPFTDFFIFKQAIRFRPDLLLGFSGTHIAHVSFLTGIPSIVIDDTDHASLAHASYKPFATHILTPEFFKKNMGKKQIKFDSYMELCALHPEYYKPDCSVLNDLGLQPEEKFILLRFVSWSASHDLGQHGLTNEMKNKIIQQFVGKYRIFISSEGKLPVELMKYELNIQPHQLHDLLYFASLYIGEGSTTASECAVLGTPAIYCNSLVVGNCQEQEEKYQICFRITSIENIISKAKEILNTDKNAYSWGKDQIIFDKVNLTKFLTWTLENYPKSIQIIKDNPNYQENFR